MDPEFLEIMGVVVLVGFFCLLIVKVKYVLVRYTINEMREEGKTIEEIEKAFREAGIYWQSYE